MSKNKAFNTKLQVAELTWRNDNPFSESYGDHYFAQEGGYEESRYVFLAQNNLPEQWANRERFIIGESGFGTGLNFLATVQSWLETSHGEQVLHYVSFEKHPFILEDLKSIYLRWPNLKKYCDELLANYPPLRAGYHRRSLFDDRIILTLAFGDIEEMLPCLQGDIDAWFLDGFAPSRNPQMWSSSFFEQLAIHSKTNTTFSTFTAAGFVRRGLRDVGFEVEKFPGFGSKREMLRGTFVEKNTETKTRPWFHYRLGSAAQKAALVIGAGIAGVFTASRLAARGWQVVLVEKNSDVAQEASGNPAGLVSPHFTVDLSHWNSFSYAAFQFAYYIYQKYGGSAWQALMLKQRLDARQQELLNSGELGDLAEQSELPGFVNIPFAGVLQPNLFCRELLKRYENNIRLVCSTEIVALNKIDSLWQAKTSRGDHFESPNVIVCNANAAAKLLPDHELQTTPVRGQISYVKGLDVAHPLNGDAYVLPEKDGRSIVGATFQPQDSETAVRQADQLSNLRKAEEILSRNISDKQLMGGRVAFRCATQDHLPLVGPLYDPQFFLTHYADIRHGKPQNKYPCAEYLEGLFINIGHGSRGLTTAPVCGELIADYLEQTPRILSQDTLEQLHSARFVIRRLKRGG